MHPPHPLFVWIFDLLLMTESVIFLGEETITTAMTMAADTWHGPLAPQKRLIVLVIHQLSQSGMLDWWGMMLRSSRYVFLPRERVYDPQNAKMARWWWPWIHLIIGAFKGSRPSHCARKVYPACSRDCSPLIGHIGLGKMAFCAVLGSHIQHQQPWWWGSLLAIGCVRTNSTVGIHRKKLELYIMFLFHSQKYF